MKSEKVWNYLFLLCFVFVWYRDEIIIIYSHWSQYYPNLSFYPYLYKSSNYFPILYHTNLSFTLAKKNHTTQYCNIVYWSEIVIGKNHIWIRILFVLSIIVNTTDLSRIVILSILVVSQKLPKSVNLYNLSQNVILYIIVWSQHHPKTIKIIKSSRIAIVCQIISNCHLAYPRLIFNIIRKRVYFLLLSENVETHDDIPSSTI